MAGYANASLRERIEGDGGGGVAGPAHSLQNDPPYAIIHPFKFTGKPLDKAASYGMMYSACFALFKYKPLFFRVP